MSTAYTLANPFPLTGNEIVDVTTNGYKWYFPAGTTRVLNWSVSSSLWTHPILQSTETQADFARAFGNIAEFINVQFNFLGYITNANGLAGFENAYLSGSDLNITYAYNGTSSSGATISDGKFTSNYQTAFCYFPDLDYNIKYVGAAGDTFLNYNNSFLANATFENGTSSFSLLLHEILHGLGLKHPHDSGGTGRPTYTSLDMKFADRQWISVMSYDLFENGGDGAYSGSQPIGPMLFDAIALQYLYGESTFNSGNTTYDLNKYVGNYYNCQWDASGTDLLDGTNLTYAIVVELDGGLFSNGTNLHHVGFVTTPLDYLALSLTNPAKWTWLWGEYENVNGSPYDDVISGNDLDNVLNGGDGDDYLTGGSGNDKFDWNSSLRGGNDTFIGGLGDDIYVLNSSGDTIVENSYEGVDTVIVGFNYSIFNTAIENIKTFSNQTVAVTFTGNAWTNILEGGAGNDSLYGNEGSDTLKGGLGNDFIDGGADTDYAVYTSIFTDLSFAVNGSDIIVTSKSEGVDTLRNVEYIRANGVDYKLSNILVSSPPTYALSPVALSVNEGSSAQFSLVTTNVVAGTLISYSITGVSVSDLQSGALTGSVAVSTTGTTSISIPIAADGITEGSETLTLTAQGKSASVVINDTSNTLNKPPTGSVLISGSAQQNQTLTATNTIKDLDGIGSITYFWMISSDNKNWTDLASGTSITLKEEQVGKYIFAYAAYTDGKGKLETVASAATSAVSNVNDLPAGSVTVVGTPKSGQTLTALNSLSDLDGLGTITYTWQSSVDGSTWNTFSTGSSVTLTDTQAGKFIAAKASYVDARGTSESVLSVKSAPVTYVDSSNQTTSYSFQNYDSAAPSNTNTGSSTTTALTNWNNILRTANGLITSVTAGTVKTQFANSDGSISINLSTGSLLLNGVTIDGNNINITSMVVTNIDSSSKFTLTGTISLNATTFVGAGTYSSLKYESGQNSGTPYGYTLKGNILDSGSIQGGTATELDYYSKNNTSNLTTTTTYNLTTASVGWDYTNSCYILSSSTSVSNLSNSTKDANGNLIASLSLSNPKTVTANISNLYWLMMGGDDKIILSGDGDRTSASGFGGNDYIQGDNGNNYFSNKVEGSTFNYSGLGDDTIDGGSGYDIIFFGSNKSINYYDFSSFDPIKHAITFIDRSSADNTGKDTAINIEQFQFSDAIIEFSQLEKMFNPINATGVGFGLLDFGTSLGDQISGTSKNDAIDGLGGNDILNGLSGNDLIWGGAGNDTIDGGEGADTAYYFNPSSNFKLSFSGGKVTLTDTLSWEGTDTLANIERLSFSNRDVIIETKSHGAYLMVPTELYQFFITAFNAAPGVSYMDQLAEAYSYGLSVKQIVDIFTTKKQFTDVYSPTLSNLELATQLVDNIVKNSASASVKSGAISDVKGALDIGWTVGNVIYTVFGNLANKSFTDKDWGNTAKQFNNEIAVAKYYTEVLNQSTTDLETLRDVIQPVTQATNVSSDAVVAQLIGVALMTGGLGT
jgi:hypothetical protein